MTTEEMFDSSIRSKRDLAGVFEYDGETGYFYLYECGGDAGQKVAGAILILSGAADFAQTDLVVRWEAGETMVGLLICGQLCAVFDAARGIKCGGNYCRGAQTHMPSEVLRAFGL
ncbi:MAG: DUF2251 domain-containing protein [Byssovorax sp.]